VLRTLPIRQFLHQVDGVLKNVCGLPRFKPPPGGIRRELQILDGTQPISTLFEMLRQLESSFARPLRV
jgi:hypothetical protein